MDSIFHRDFNVSCPFSSDGSIASRLVDCISDHGHWVLTINYVEGSLEVFELIF